MTSRRTSPSCCRRRCSHRRPDRSCRQPPAARPTRACVARCLPFPRFAVTQWSDFLRKEPSSHQNSKCPVRMRQRCAVRGSRRGMADSPYAIVDPDAVDDSYDGSYVPGEFRRLTEALGCEQLAATLIRVPPHSDFEQGTGHFHDEVEELYLVTRGTLTMRFGDDVQVVAAGSAVRVAPRTKRSHRKEGDEPVEIWALSRRIESSDATKIDDFWEPSPDAAQRVRERRASGRERPLGRRTPRPPAEDRAG